MNKRQRKQYYRAWSSFQQKQEKYWLPKIYKALQFNNNAFADYLLKNGVSDALAMIDTIVKYEPIMTVLNSLYKTVGLRRARIVTQEIRKDDQKAAVLGFNEQMTRDIQRYFELYLLNKSVRPITDTQKKRIRQIMDMAIHEGWSTEQMATAVQSSRHNLYQARVVVRTETVRAANAGGQLAENRSEFLMDKEWISAQDIRVRHPPKSHFDHVDLDGQVVPGERPFFSAGEELMFPGDPAGSAGNVIQCRCTAAYTIRRDETGRLMRKPANWVPTINLTAISEPINLDLLPPATVLEPSSIEDVIVFGVRELFEL